MATLAIQAMTNAGLEATFASANSGGDEFVNTGNEFIQMKNGATDSICTIATAATLDGFAVADQVVTTSANEERLIGPFTPATFNDSANKIQLTYDSVANVTIAIVSMLK